MNYAGYIENDCVNGEGVCVSLWTQGCPHKCLGCHNPETWSGREGQPIPQDILDRLIKAIPANGIKRNFSVLGGEPLYEHNLNFVLTVLKAIKETYPDIKIFLWTGYCVEDLDKNQQKIFDYVDVIIDGPFIITKRDISLKWRGSTNQRILTKEQALALINKN